MYACRGIRGSKEIGKRNRPKGGGGQWEETYLFRNQFTQPVIFGILLAITKAEKEI